MKNSFHPTIQMLNEYQKAAIYDTGRAVLVNACVGSGKTTVLTEKVAWLHQQKGIPYEQMMVLTFTNKAADEIRDRLGIEAPYFGTFHSAAMQLLLSDLPEEEAFTVIEPEEELALAEELIAAHKLKIKYKNRLAKRLEQEKSVWKKGGLPRYRDDLFALYPLLQAEKQARKQKSFDDLLEQCLALLKQKKDRGTPFYPLWLIVDEVQDCNQMQVDLLAELYGPDTSLFAVGDPNQMIYSFRGGDGSLFYRIRDLFKARELTLPVNYRSDPAILQIANRLRQYGNQVVSGLEEGKAEDISRKIPVHNYYDPFQEAEILAVKITELHRQGTPWSEIAVLFRMQEQALQLEKTFSLYGIPPEEIHLLTLHASKGLEFDVVFIIGLNPGLIPLNGKGEAEREEEQRLLFVGMTRARKILELSWYTNPGRPPAVGGMSPFLKMIPERFLDMENSPAPEERQAHLQELRAMVRLEQKKGKEALAKTREADPDRKAEAAGGKARSHGGEETPHGGRAESAGGSEGMHYAVHPRYGRGRILEDNGMMVKVEFDGYGVIEFLKAFGELLFE